MASSVLLQFMFVYEWCSDSAIQKLICCYYPLFVTLYNVSSVSCTEFLKIFLNTCTSKIYEFLYEQIKSFALDFIIY